MRSDPGGPGWSRAAEILMIEDSPGDARLTQEALEEGPVPKNVRVVTDGEEALLYLRREGDYRDAARPDLILLDLNLPRQDGRELLQQIKADPELCAIPVIVLTSSSTSEDVQQAYRLRANCYISKPTDLKRYFQAIHAVESFWLGVASIPAP